jgi:hypothetical protein
LRRVALELRQRNHLKPDDVEAAAGLMQQSSDLFRALRYEEDLPKAGHILGRIADTELKALAHMEKGWEEVRKLSVAGADMLDAAAE